MIKQLTLLSLIFCTYFTPALAQESKVEPAPTAKFEKLNFTGQTFDPTRLKPLFKSLGKILKDLHDDFPELRIIVVPTPNKGEIRNSEITDELIADSTGDAIGQYYLKTAINWLRPDEAGRYIAPYYHPLAADEKSISFDFRRPGIAEHIILIRSSITKGVFLHELMHFLLNLSRGEKAVYDVPKVGKMSAKSYLVFLAVEALKNTSADKRLPKGEGAADLNTGRKHFYTLVRHNITGLTFGAGEEVDINRYLINAKAIDRKREFPGATTYIVNNLTTIKTVVANIKNHRKMVKNESEVKELSPETLKEFKALVGNLRYVEERVSEASAWLKNTLAEWAKED